MTRTVTGLTLAMVAAMICVVSWLLLYFPKSEGRGEGREVELVLSELEDERAVVARLHEEGIVAHPLVFTAYLRLFGADRRLRRGHVQLDDSMTPEQIARTIAVGLGDGRTRITFPEGFSRYDIASRLSDYHVCDADAFVAATEDPELLNALDIEAASAEGYLFPDTYELFTDTPAAEVVSLMVRTFHRRVGAVVEEHAEGMARLEADLGWGVFEVLTLASIVEKEAAVADERPRIAGVFLNRLRSETFVPHRLQADPTVSYGCRVAPDSTPPCRGYSGGAPSATMVRDRDNPYNTYVIEGLPPGPIANPGISAIRGVIDAETHDYYFFVARGGGRHQFSRTLAEHDAAVDEHLR